MVVFAIPFRAPGASKNYDVCVKKLKQTLDSIFNQTCDYFRCIVACNEIPNELRGYDERLEFIQLDIPAPTTWIEMARDKYYKLTEIAVRIREILEQTDDPEAGIYVMPVDADDLLHCKIAEYCHSFPNENGFVSKYGYVWAIPSKVLRIYKDMHTYCGSCNIIKMYREDLPLSNPCPKHLCHDGETAGKLNAVYPIRFDHHIVVEKYANQGKPFAYLPFKSTIYVRGHGDNISCFKIENSNSDSDKDRFHPIAFLRSINIFRMKYIDKKVRKKFGIDND